VKAGLLSGFAFLVPVLVTAAVFQHQDPQSLQRFKTQATVGGLSRGVEMKVSGTGQGSMEGKKSSFVSKYANAVRFSLGLGPVGILQFVAWIVALVFWFGLVVTSSGDWRGRIALAVSGFASVVLPFLLFPLQGNYLLLGRTILPFVLLANFLGSRDVLRYRRAPLILIAVNLAFLLPIVCLSLIVRTETKATFGEATGQVEKLKQYLAGRNQQGDVVLVPATHYFLYKTELNNLFNEAYLSPQHDVSQVAAVVNCPTASAYFDAASKPLNPLVSGSTWSVLDSDNHPQLIGIWGKRIMRKNWTWGCVVYVKQPDKTFR
jgi:hypothetical protein